MNYLPGSHPAYECVEAAEFEKQRWGGDESQEWPAMQAAGLAVARALIDDLAVAGVSPGAISRVLVLVGKGHNGGDAMLAARDLIFLTPCLIEVGFVFGQNELRPLAARAWRDLQTAGPAGRVRAVTRSEIKGPYTALIDGVFGFQFRAPLRDPAVAWLAQAAAASARLRVAVDLPSGQGEAGAFEADATYATGILKTPSLKLPNAGRLRYLDLGFFDGTEAGETRILTAGILAPVQELRPAACDKRTFGHLAVVGGSRQFPGAVGMSVAAALQSGVGNVSAFVPASVAAAFAARWPEAMWVGCPETEDGSLAMESGLIIRSGLDRATAMLIGPGLGREPETMTLAESLIHESTRPLVLDADALQPGLVRAGQAPRILTPHQGEHDRIGGEISAATVTVLKGPVTRVMVNAIVYHGLEGGPILARGGSGDLLAGLIAGRLAVNPSALPLAAAAGVFWHGRAARLTAQRHGETAIRITQVLDQLNPALRPT